MLRLLLLVTSIAVLGGCASQDTFDYTPQYCYTDEVSVISNDNTVNSSTVVQCTDRPGQQQIIARAGIDKSCEEYWYDEMRWGRPVKQRGVRCEKLDGSWEVLNIGGSTR